MSDICLEEAFCYCRFKTFKEQEICVRENSYYIHMKWLIFFTHCWCISLWKLLWDCLL